MLFIPFLDYPFYFVPFCCIYKNPSFTLLSSLISEGMIIGLSVLGSIVLKGSLTHLLSASTSTSSSIFVNHAGFLPAAFCFLLFLICFHVLSILPDWSISCSKKNKPSFFSWQKLFISFWFNRPAISVLFSANCKLFSISSKRTLKFILLASVRILYARLCLSLTVSNLCSSRVVMHVPLLQLSCACLIHSHVALPMSPLLFSCFLSSVIW